MRWSSAAAVAVNAAWFTICHAQRDAGTTGYMAATCASEAATSTVHQRARGVSSSADTTMAPAGHTTPIGEF